PRARGVRAAADDGGSAHQPVQRGLGAAHRALQRQGVPHGGAAQRAARGGAELRPPRAVSRPDLARRDGVPRAGRRGAETRGRTRERAERPGRSGMTAATAKKTRLGRGLDALLGKTTAVPGAASGAEPQEPQATAPEPAPGGDTLRNVPVDLLVRGRYQPRVDMRQETLEDLASSIRAQGVVQPIVVRPVAGGRYEIVAGERRWRAAQMAGLAEIPAVVRDIPDEAAIAMALIENIQRENLNPLEEARALDRLIREFDL